MKMPARSPARIAAGLVLGLAVLCAALPAPLQAARASAARYGERAQVPWQLKRMTLKAENKEIGELLRQLAASNGLAIQIDERIKGTVSASFSKSPQEILDQLGTSYGFFAFYDGTAIIVTPLSDVKSDVVHMAPAAIANLTDTLRRLGIYDARFPIRIDEPNRLVILSGPTRYVEMLSGVLRALHESAEQRSPTEVLVYPLKYAWADDRTVSTSNGSVVIPGIVSVLKGIYVRGEERSSVTGSTTLGRPRARRPMLSLDGNRSTAGYDRPGDDGQTTIRQTVNQVLQSAGVPPGSSQPHALPVIVADVRRNAVIVRDLADRLRRHKDLLQELDTRSALVEVEAQIVDVRSEAVESLGLDWRGAGSHVDVQVGSGSSDNPLSYRPSLARNPIDAALPDGGRFTIMAGNAARFLISRIHALEGDGKARTVGTPRVTTLDNVQSVMSSKEVFYVKVSGAYASDLFEVSTGVSLSVLPFVIHEDDGISVRMAVNITDGSVDTASRVDDLPITRTSEINAEAIVREGSSLLIAGYAREEDSSSKSGVPVLSSVPVLGGLFRSNSKSTVRQERFFLLTPKVITP